MRNILKNMIVALSSTAIAVIGIEVALQVFRPIHYLAPVTLVPGNKKPEILHRRSDIPGLVYELVPNFAHETEEGFVRTNSYGMRDDEPLKDSPDLLRIASIGDSYTFGARVKGNEAYPNVTEDLLRAVRAPHPVEVLNFGVLGYSSADEAIVVRYKALPLKPDLILVGYVLNDPETWPIQPLHRYFTSNAWYRRLNLTRLAMRAYRGWAVRHYGDGNYTRFLHAPSGPTWPTVKAAFAEIGRLAAQESIPVIVVIFPYFPIAGWQDYKYQQIHAQVAAAARAAGLDTLDLLDDYRKYPIKALRVLPNNMHPSVLGHRIAAEAIVRKLERDYPALIHSAQPHPHLVRDGVLPDRRGAPSSAEAGRL